MRKLLLLVFVLTNQLNETFAQKIYDLHSVTVSADKVVDTVFGTWKFSVADYVFIDDKLLLLTYTKSLQHAKVVLTDNAQKVISTFDLPDEAFKLYKDYLGYTNVVCANHIYRIILKDNVIHLGSLPVDDYKQKIMPCIDTVQTKVYFSNYDKNYPEFSYYAFNTADSTYSTLKTISDEEEMKEYNMEYYFLKPKERVDAMYLADYFGVDKHRIAAAMSGVTSSMFYTPLYAPLFVANDTTYVFDHYHDAIFKFDKEQKLIDSVHIDYNHPKNWREWKQKLLFDKEENKVYAVFQKGGFYYLKQIDLISGKVNFTYKMVNQYVSNMKVKNGYVYYTYSPFESLQEFFVYKELIK